MNPKKLERDVAKVLECCRHNACLIEIIDGEIDDIQLILEDHETRIDVLEAGPAVVSITPVENYSALPDPTTVPGQFYFVKNAQGTSWLPGSLGGTYYKAGLYYSDGVSWLVDVDPWQADQAEVDAGLVANEFVTPLTLANATTVSHPGHTHDATEIGNGDVDNTELSTLNGVTSNVQTQLDNKADVGFVIAMATAL